MIGSWAHERGGKGKERRQRRAQKETGERKGKKYGEGRKRVCARATAGGRAPRRPRPPPTSFTLGSRGRSVLARAFRSLSCACAQVSASRGRGNPARSRHVPSCTLPGARPFCACAGESGGSGCRLWGDIACQSVGRSSRRPSPSRFSAGGAVESAPGIPRWGRSGDGGSGITEPERERPRGPVPGGGHGRPSPRPQPGRHRPVRPAGERAAPQPRPAATPAPFRAPAAARPPPSVPLRSPRAADSGSQFGPRPGVPRPHSSLLLYLYSGSGSPSSQVFEGHPLVLLSLQNLYRDAPPWPLTCFEASFPPCSYLALLPPSPLFRLLEF